MASGGSTRQEVGPRPVVLRAFGYFSAAGLALYAVLLSRQRQVDFEVYRMGGHHVLGSISTPSRHRCRRHSSSPTPTGCTVALAVLGVTGEGQVVWDITKVVALTALVAVSSAPRADDRSCDRTGTWPDRPRSRRASPLASSLRSQLGQIDLVLVLMIVTDLTIGVSWRGSVYRRAPRGPWQPPSNCVAHLPPLAGHASMARREKRCKRVRSGHRCDDGAHPEVFVELFHEVRLRRAPNWRQFHNEQSDTPRRAARAGLAQSPVAVDLLLVIVLVLAWHSPRCVPPLVRSSGVLLCAATGLLISPISWQHHYVWCVPLVVWLIFGVDRPRRAAVWALIAAMIMMVMPPGHSSDLSVMWYVRENSYLLATVGSSRSGACCWRGAGPAPPWRWRGAPPSPWPHRGSNRRPASAPSRVNCGGPPSSAGPFALARAMVVLAYGAMSQGDPGRVELPRLRRPRAEEPPRVTISHVRLLDG